MGQSRAVLTVLLVCGAAAPVQGQDVAALLDVAPRERQKPYSPALEETVAVTPPPFVWIPVGRSSRYVLQVAPTAEFHAADTRTWRGITTSVFVPPEVLPAGQWFWRYGVETADGDVLGKPRPFTVPETARPFPFPDLDEVLASVPQEHPRLFFPGAQLERIRAAAADELAEPVAGLVRRCRAVVGAEIVPEPPRPSTGPERVTVMRTTRPPMDDMERCALAYLLTGDRELGAEARRRILHFFSWDPGGPTGLWSYDEPAMWVMMRGVRAYDWTWELFTDAERRRIEPVMKERTRQFFVHLKDRRRFETDPYESHAGRMPGFLGEAALCFAHEWPEAREWLRYSMLLYMTSYPAWGGDDGGWQEGPGYWSAYMSFALHFVVALRHATGVDLMEKPFFRNTPYYALYTATPYHSHRPFGDGATSSPRGLGQVLYAFSSLLQDPHLRWYQEESGQTVGASLLTLSTWDSTLEARHPGDLPPGREFPSVGLAALHTALGTKEKDVTFLLRSSPFGSVSHGHADQNAFVIEAFGEGLALATGYYPWYGSPHHQDWTRATRAVNSVLVDGEGQVRRSWQARGEITAFVLGEDYDYLAGEAAEAYGGRLEHFHRQVVHVRPGIFVIYDDLRATEPATFQWLLHTPERVTVEGNRLSMRRGPAVLEAHLLAPQGLEITQDDRYLPEPEQQETRPLDVVNTWHLTASTREPSRAAGFLAVLAVRRSEGSEGSAVERLTGDGGIGVNLTHPDGARDNVVFRTPEAPTDSGFFFGGVRVLAGGRDSAGRHVRRLGIIDPRDKDAEDGP